jgi:(acyl-carrier-protein) S-malonyltransferase
VSRNDETRRQGIDGLVEALMQYIDEANPAEIEELASRGGERTAVVSAARAAVARARSEVAQRRRERVRERMRSASFKPTPDVSQLSLAELKAILAEHVANDDASRTMAARHEKGEMDEAELRSVVADILRLRQNQDE